MVVSASFFNSFKIPSGITMGTCCTFLICAAVHYYSRWPVGFYISGGLQITWSFLWVLLVTDFPKAHSFISKEELEYLINTIGNVFTIKVGNVSVLRTKENV